MATEPNKQTAADAESAEIQRMIDAETAEKAGAVAAAAAAEKAGKLLKAAKPEPKMTYCPKFSFPMVDPSTGVRFEPKAFTPSDATNWVKFMVKAGQMIKGVAA